MSNQRVTYSEVSRAAVTDTRNVVVSTCSRGGFTVAQQVKVTESKNDSYLFLKGAIHVDDVEGLKRMRDALTVCIDYAEKVQAEEAWDEQ